MGTNLTPKRVLAALELSNGSVTKAAKVLGVSRQAVHTRMRQYGITVDKIPRLPTDDGSAA